MRKRHLIFLILPLCFILLSAPVFSGEAEIREFSVGGAVQNPMQLTLSDLQQFRQEAIPAYDGLGSTEKKTIRYGAVPLKTLLGLTKTQGLSQELAISIKNHRGDQIVLSYGEIALSTRNHVFVASSVDIGGNKFRQDLPALILERNKNYRVALQGIVFIEVIPIALFRPDSGNLLRVALPEYFTGKLIGTKPLLGYALHSVFDKIGVQLKQTDVLNIATRDGNAVVSSEELRDDAAPLLIPKGNTYNLAFPEDGSKERWLENIDHLEIISLKQKPMMYVVGVGCGDPNLLTNEAITIMGKADVFVSKDDYQKTFAGYIAGRPVLFDPFMQLARYQKTKRPELTDSEAEKIANAVYADNIQMLRKALQEGKIIALLEPGDPTLYGGWRNWLSEYIPRNQVRVIAGMSSFSVANAVLGEYDLTKNPIIIAEPEELKTNEPLIQTAAQNGNVIVVFMGLNRMKSLVSLLGKYFPSDTPLHVVYHAGIAGKERRIQTSLSKAVEVTGAEKENFLGLIYVGRDLKSSGKQVQ